MISLKFEDLYRIIEKKTKEYIFHQIEITNILNEIDYQFKIINYLESLIDDYSDLNWKIFNCYYLKKPKMYPDVLIFHSNNPIICIELKFFRFKPPSRQLIINDINKLHKYFKDYPSLKRGYSFNTFSLTSNNFSKIDQMFRNKIKDDRISIVNLNLREIEDYKKTRKNYYYNIKLLYSHFSKWEKYNF